MLGGEGIYYSELIEHSFKYPVPSGNCEENKGSTAGGTTRASS